MEFDNDCSFTNKSAEEELHVLQSIYSENELKVERTTEVLRLTFKINPDLAASSEIVSRRYISLQLEIELDKNYPACSPNVKIRNPRGLNDDEVIAFEAQISTFMAENVDLPVLYDLIQMAQDFSNREEVPSLPCSICLCKFAPDDSIFVTGECHHHFHSYCLGRYVEHCLKEKSEERDRLPQIEKNTIDDAIYCPICRCSIECPEIKDLLSNSPPNNDQPGADTSSNDWSHLADPIGRQFHDLYEKQKAQGGLIDHEKERQRMLLTDDNIFVAQTPNQPTTSIVKDNDLPEPSTSSKKVSQSRRNRKTPIKDLYNDNRMPKKYSDYNKRFEPILNCDFDDRDRLKREEDARDYREPVHKTMGPYVNFAFWFAPPSSRDAFHHT